MPDQLHFVPIDFAAEDLPAKLQASPYDPRLRSFFSWLGVTYYLPRRTVFRTLHSLASLVPRGSTIVFDYLDAEAFLPGAPPRVQRMLAASPRAGEPMQDGLDAGSLDADLRAVGLTLREHVGPPEIQARYFAHRTDAYSAFEHVHFVAARFE